MIQGIRRNAVTIATIMDDTKWLHSGKDMKWLHLGKVAPLGEMAGSRICKYALNFLPAEIEALQMTDSTFEYVCNLI